MKPGKNYLHGLLFMGTALSCSTELWSQPFVDPFQVRYTYAFRNKQAKATPFTHLWVGTDLPVKLKKNTYLLISPFYEQWRIDSADKKEIYPAVHSIALPVGLILPLHTKWSLTMISTARWNGEKLFDKNSFQFGAAILAGYAPKTGQKFRLGLYANKEFFGWFVVPLLGTDWRIDQKNYLFGVLPGRLTFEHQWNKNLYGGATFRSLTNSYRLSNQQYVRLEDNQLSLYLDYYPAKHFCLSLEPGYGVFRKIRTGNNNKDYITSVKSGDGPFIKLSASYRIRF